jgi:hypothetical protein
VNNTRKGRGRMRSWSNVTYYPGIFLEGLRKTTIPRLGWVISQPRFKPGTFRLQARRANAWVNFLGWKTAAAQDSKCGVPEALCVSSWTHIDFDNSILVTSHPSHCTYPKMSGFRAIMLVTFWPYHKKQRDPTLRVNFSNLIYTVVWGVLNGW